MKASNTEFLVRRLIVEQAATTKVTAIVLVAKF